MGSEQEAREEIDRLLAAAGWRVQDAKAANIHASLGVAIREFPLKEGHGFADYMLYVDGEGLLRGDPGGHGSKLRTDGADLCRDYRAEPCRVLSGMIFSSLARVRAMVSTLAPVSIAVELETLVMRSLRNFSGSSRYGLVSMSGFFRIAR